MKKLQTILLFALIVSCSKPVSSKPDVKDVIGVWECSDFPDAFLKKAGIAKGAHTSRIEIREDGSLSIHNFPQRSPYRLTDYISGSSWEFRDPSITPSGSWCIEHAGQFLECRQHGGRLELRYIISGKDGYTITYKKKN